MTVRKWLGPSVVLLAAPLGNALEKPNITYSVFQFPADQIPRVDGNAADWAMVSESYTVGMDQLWDDSKKHPTADPQNLDVRVKVGWVKGLNRLYFLYEATDNYWDFARPDLHNDTFEIVVDGDASGGPLLGKDDGKFWNKERVGTSATPEARLTEDDSRWAIHGVHAQNYHIFTPAAGKDWCLAWGAATWIKEFPWANAATAYSFKPGEGGKLTLEFWITPFDYAGPEGPHRAVESVLSENKIIGLAWAVIDYDDVNRKGSNGFWNLSPKHTMFGDASELCAFRLMPLDPSLLPKLAAQWSWTVVDMDRRLVAFKDLSVGATAWKWDFGDGSSSTEQHPQHAYAKPGRYVIILDVTAADGTTARRSKVWDVQLK